MYSHIDVSRHDKQAWWRCTGILLLLGALAGGCRARYAASTPPAPVWSHTWNGHHVEIIENNVNSSSRSTSINNQRMEIGVNGHQVTLTEKTVSLNGVKRPFGPTSRVSIHNDAGNVSLYVDNEYVLP